MPVELVFANDPRWSSTLLTSNAGIFYTPEYSELTKEAYSAPALLLYKDDLGLAFDVTAVKQIASLPFYESVAGQFSSYPIDLANANYNGPILVAQTGDRPELLRRYRKALGQFCADNHVVTEFIRFHPFYEYTELISRDCDLLPASSDQMFVDLRAGYAAARLRYRKAHKWAVNKALRDGATSNIVEPDDNHLVSFVRLYEWTQRRNGARSNYVQSGQFFRSLFDVLTDRVWLVESRTHGDLVSSSIYLADKPYIWYLYSGSALELLGTRAHKYSMDRMIARAAQDGFSYLVMGGAGNPHDADDGIARFKRGFSRLVGKVHQLRKVHNDKTLQMLLLAKEHYNRSLGRGVCRDWFPSYWLD